MHACKSYRHGWALCKVGLACSATANTIPVKLSLIIRMHISLPHHAIRAFGASHAQIRAVDAMHELSSSKVVCCKTGGILASSPRI